MDRDQPNDVSDEPATSRDTRYPGTECGNDRLETVQPLTDNFGVLRTKVNAMDPSGNTNITIGLVWGLALLSPEAPFSEGAPWGMEDLTKIIILMTDGDNTENRWTHSASAIDARTQVACRSVKDAGVTLYTVRLIEGNPALLSQCATSLDTYFDVETVQDLLPTFEAIGEQLSQLRIAR
jgi:hypothetical protein